MGCYQMMLFLVHCLSSIMFARAHFAPTGNILWVIWIFSVDVHDNRLPWKHVRTLPSPPKFVWNIREQLVHGRYPLRVANLLRMAAYPYHFFSWFCVWRRTSAAMMLPYKWISRIVTMLALWLGYYMTRQSTFSMRFHNPGIQRGMNHF